MSETVEGGASNSNSDGPKTVSTSQPRQPIPEIEEELPQESEWMVAIRDHIKQAQEDESKRNWEKFSIFRVPKTLRDVHKEAYDPKIVSIGPYHHGKQQLHEMERHKWRSLNQVLKRTKHDVSLYLDSVRAIEKEARDCYDCEIDMNSEEFVQLMVLDGCFMLEMLRATVGKGLEALGYSQNDPVFKKPRQINSVMKDMIMLENQIPLFVLDRLLACQAGYPETHQTYRGLVVLLILRFFDPLMPNNEPLRKADRQKLESTHDTIAASFDPLSHDGLHCLDVFHRSLLLNVPSRQQCSNTSGDVLSHCVTELRRSGIRFRRHDTESFLNIKFQHGVLWIPRITIEDRTKIVFPNLIALEQCRRDNHFTSYVVFMDLLINSGQDVRHLVYKEIIKNGLGNDDEVADLFNALCQEVLFDASVDYLSPVSKQINLYYDQRWNTWWTTLKRNYFGNPWSIVSLVAAGFLILLTLAQTVLAFLSYFKPPH